MTAILDIVRLESGQVRPRREAVDLAVALDDMVARTTQAQPAQRILTDVPADLPHPRLDPALLDRVLENLLDNAVKFGGGADIRLMARRQAGEVVLMLEDDGPGIPASDLPRIFDAFFRAARSDSVTAGSGLGLAICRGLVGAMGGRISAESPIAAGRGTRMILRFPL